MAPQTSDEETGHSAYAYNNSTLITYISTDCIISFYNDDSASTSVSN